MSEKKQTQLFINLSQIDEVYLRSWFKRYRVVKGNWAEPMIVEQQRDQCLLELGRYLGIVPKTGKVSWDWRLKVLRLLHPLEHWLRGSQPKQFGKVLELKEWDNEDRTDFIA